MDYLEKLQVFVEEEQPSKFFSLWEEYCFNDIVKGDELVQILQKVKNSFLAPLFGKIADTVLPLWEKIPEGEEKDRVLQLILDLQTSNSREFYDIALEYVNKKYLNHKNFNEALWVVGLRDGRDFQYSLSRFEFLMHLREGNFVFHHGGWGVGEVMGVSFLQQKILVEFEGVMMAKDISFETAFKTLRPLSKEHFLSRRFGDPDKFEEYAKEHPVEVIEILLRDLGPKTAKEIKDELVDLVIPEAEWGRWWQSAKAKIKKDIRITSPDSAKDPYKCSPLGDSHLSQLTRKYGLAHDNNERIALLYQFVRDLHSELKKAPTREALIKMLKELPVGEDKAMEIQRDLLLSEYLGEKGFVLNGQYVASLSEDEVARFLDKIPIVALQKSFLSLVKKFSPEWKAIFLQIFLHTSSPMLRESVYKALRGDEGSLEVLKQKILECVHQPMMFPGAFSWFFMKFGAHEDGIFDPRDKEMQRMFLEATLTFMYQVASTPYKELGKKLYNFLVGQRFLVIREMIENASEAFLKEFLLLSTKIPQFSSGDLSILQGLAEVVQPSLKRGRSAVEEEDVFWVTSQSFSRMKEKLQSLVGKEMVDNAREIEDARALGDLRENSEYKFALERRARLQEEIRVLSEEINKAKILTKADVHTHKVGVGCRVTLEDAQGSIEYTLLGSWDADSEKNILSLQSKLAQMLLGKNIDERVQLQGREYRIAKIVSIFDE